MTTIEDPSHLAEIQNLDSIQCGEDAAKHFYHDAGYRNLNHASYGTYPIEVGNVSRHYQRRSEARPDTFVRYEYRTRLLTESRTVIAEYLHAPTDTCVLVPNASTGIDTILYNLLFKQGDVAVCFDTIYSSFESTLQRLVEHTPVQYIKVKVAHPLSRKQVIEGFENTIKDLRSQGRNPRIAIFDTISSLPGIRMPFERLTEICRVHGVLSCIDGAHGAGQIPLDLGSLDPDFFTSNLHKWLYVPRSCAVLYVPDRNQYLLKATFPTGYGYLPFPKDEEARKDIPNNFIHNFAYPGTKDDTPYLCVEAALEWRKKVKWSSLKGEEAIMSYIHQLARGGGQAVATMLGTEILDDFDGSFGDCALTNVRLPMNVRSITREGRPTLDEIASSITKKMTLDHDIAANAFAWTDAVWVRLSAQVYLTFDDFKLAGEKLKTICDEICGTTEISPRHYGAQGRPQDWLLGP